MHLQGGFTESRAGSRSFLRNAQVLERCCRNPSRKIFRVCPEDESAALVVTGAAQLCRTVNRRASPVMFFPSAVTAVAVCVTVRGTPWHNAYSDLTSDTSFVSDVFASPKSMFVFSSKNSSFSMPANPGFMPRLSTMILRASLTLRMGMP